MTSTCPVSIRNPSRFNRWLVATYRSSWKDPDGNVDTSVYSPTTKSSRFECLFLTPCIPHGAQAAPPPDGKRRRYRSTSAQNRSPVRAQNFLFRVDGSCPRSPPTPLLPKALLIPLVQQYLYSQRLDPIPSFRIRLFPLRSVIDPKTTTLFFSSRRYLFRGLTSYRVVSLTSTLVQRHFALPTQPTVTTLPPHSHERVFNTTSLFVADLERTAAESE